jgi:hypothetical protein
MKRNRTLLGLVFLLTGVGCASPPSSPVPEGLRLTVESESRVDGSFAHGGDWIRFSATVLDGDHSEVVVESAGGVVVRSVDHRFVQLGGADLSRLDEAGIAAAEPLVADFLSSPEAELVAGLFRHIDTPTAELSPALGALYATSSSLETGVSGEPLSAEPPPEARACWNKCCGTDCDCYHYNPCPWWDPTCNYCARHDACIHYYRDHRGWSNAAATAWCT